MNTQQPQSIPELMEHARRTQAALTTERVALAERRAAYELRAQFAPPPVAAPERWAGSGAIFWLFWMVALLADLAILFGAGLWLRASGNPLAVVGLAGAVLILVLLLAAPVRMGRGRA